MINNFENYIAVKISQVDKIAKIGRKQPLEFRMLYVSFCGIYNPLTCMDSLTFNYHGVFHKKYLFKGRGKEIPYLKFSTSPLCSKKCNKGENGVKFVDFEMM